MNKRELIMAGRLCNIERLIGKSATEFTEEHKRLFARYMDVEILSDILAGKPEHQQECALLLRAKELSLSESEKSPIMNDSRHLASVFSRLSAGGETVSEKRYYRFEKLTPYTIFPQEKRTDDLRELQTAFEEELLLLERAEPDSFSNFCVSFDRILQKYTWSITASDYEGEDISLYDHLKVTEAILTCLVECSGKNGEDLKPYCLLMGDFSGIQNYIFSIASANQSGVAKRLRARSFYVDIMIRIFAQYVIDRFDVGRANILMQTGGKFYILLPAKMTISERLIELRKELDLFLYQEFKGKVSVNLAWLMTDDKGLENYSDTIVELNRRLGIQKARPFSEVIKNSAGWDEESFIVYKGLSGKHICKGCGSELIDKNAELCNTCELQLKMGRQLANANYILYEKKPGENAGKSFRIFREYYIRLAEEGLEKSNAFYIEKLHHTVFRDAEYAYPISQKYMVNHVPKEKRNGQAAVLSFSEIAGKSGGMDKLAVLKADVDVLGYLFADGLRKRQRHYGTISRINTMSRMLELFFSGYINELLETKPEYRYVYSVFSGGDDLFLIGPWDVMPKLAIEIQESFHKFAAGNPCVTLSAAISVFRDKEHVAVMAENSENQLERAKNEVIKEVYPDREGRNCVCFMGEIFTWEDFKVQTARAGQIARLLRHKKLDVGVLRRLSHYSRMYRRYLREGDTSGLMFHPLMSYDRNRNYRFDRNDAEQESFCRYIDGMLAETEDYSIVKKDLYFAEIIVKYALNLTKEDRNDAK